MVKPKASELKKQIKKQDEEVYGEETMSGSSPDPASDDDVAETLEKTVGTDLKSGDEFNLGEEVERDERARRTKPKS
ncbi:hypothetical protein IID22_04245 [Patescibacteria group bacterium]|nr:hypothetical protein [Patescibacteria group bacterium]